MCITLQSLRSKSLSNITHSASAVNIKYFARCELYENIPKIYIK